MSSVMARFIQHEQADKVTNEQLAAIAADLTPPLSPTSFRKQLFNTDCTNHKEESTAGNVDQSAGRAVQSPTGPDLATISEIAELKFSLQDNHSKMQAQPHKSTSSLPRRLRRPLLDGLAISDSDLMKSFDVHRIPEPQIQPTT